MDTFTGRTLPESPSSRSQPLDLVPPRPQGLRVVARERAGVVTVVLDGELDIATNADLHHCARTALTQGNARHLVIECGGLSFVGAAGLGTLLAIQHLAARQSTTMLLIGATPMMRKLVKITQLEAHLALAPPDRRPV